MRITTLLLSIQACFATMLLAGSISAQTINLNVKQANIKQVFTAIEKQSGMTFVYNEQTLQGLKPISIQATDKPIADVLRDISEKVPLLFKQSGNVIGVSRAIIKASPSPSFLLRDKHEIAPPKTITGIVIDENGQPLPGATIKIKGTSLATTTDNGGNFTLNNLPAQATLIISFIGYEQKEVEAVDKMTISLVKSSSKLDEVQVIAYGTTTQRLNTGNTSKVGAEIIEEQPVSNPLAALEGRVPGLIVSQNNGIPGGSFTVQIRGRGSINNGTTPLFVIDGVPFNATSLDEINGGVGITGQSPLNSINPLDIESIEVLKDADATAIYGSRGANGVILITTKKGKVGKTKFTANVYSGAGEVTRTMDYLSTAQYTEMRREAFKNDGITPTVNNAPDLLVWDTASNTNWKKLLIGGTAYVTDAQTNLTGGNVQTQFLLGGNYHHETTVFPGELADNRANLHFNLTHSSLDNKFNLTFSTSYSNDNNNLITTDLATLINTPPNAPPPYDAYGNLVWSEGGISFVNPVGYTLQTYQANTDNLVSNAIFRYTVLPGLNIKTNLGYTTTELTQSYLKPKDSFNPSSNPVSSAIFGDNTVKTWIIEPQAEYNFKINKHKFDLLIGSSWQQSVTSGNKINASNFTSDALISSPAAAGTVTSLINYSLYRYDAVFGRINYNYDDEYLVNITGRRDGSTRFGPGNQFANFGALGAGWVFSQEKWVKENANFISFGKLRGSYGITGNDQIGDYKFLDTWAPTPSPYQATTGLKASALSNPDYAWEINRKLEMGLEIGVLNDRVILTSSYFHDISSNQLINYSLPAQTGFTSIFENFPATVQNSGWEFEANTTNIKQKDFNWSSSFNLSVIRNKLLAFNGLATSSYSTLYSIGYSLDIKKLLVYEGVNPQTGLYQFNGTTLPQSETSIKTLTPQFYGGFQNNLKYKGFQLEVFFQFVKQNGINAVGGGNQNAAPGTMYNQPVSVLGRWVNPGDQTDIQKFTTQNSGSGIAGTAYSNYAVYSDGKITDASFIRLKNLSLSYSLPREWIKTTKADAFKIYVQGQNLITLTHYKGNDPESGITDPTALPPLRVLTVGIQFTY